ncbi:GTPase [Metallosphaera tengchongensis]|uniref:GTPase n=1 Tax=Metallosphaera tengchongensis TaxID=1532350 RepID=A0A6N0NVH5_9CREN|nr:ATP/GTP-binding protein [Metallosphaera tengchongensis]QKQ99427.1 GTPase [Metallosphaera tengchongensis]
MYYVFFTGTAGSGKTTMVKEFQGYLLDQDMDVAVINMDPAVEGLPYYPDLDVREYVDATEVMRRYGLGPNSSLIASIDLLLTKASEIKGDLDSVEANYVLVDTPGQVELFAYRETGRYFSSLLVGGNKSVNVFLMDSSLAKEARSYVSLLLLSSSVRFKLGMPQVNVLSKVDLLSRDELDALMRWGEGEEIVDHLGVIDEYSFELVKALLENMEVPPVPVSSNSGEGFDELYAEIQRVVAGGEDFATEENNSRQ